jgi:hypothetical protein
VAALAVLSSVFVMGCPPLLPAIQVSVTLLRFQLTDPDQKTFQISNLFNSRTPLTFNVSADQDWIEVSPTSGTSTGPGDPKSVTVTIVRDSKQVQFNRGTITITSNGGNRTINVVASPNYFTELFAGSGGTELFDLQNKTITFTPDDSLVDFYEVAVSDAADFPTTPGGIALDFAAGDPLAATVPFGGQTVKLYGRAYSMFWISSKGYISFGGPGQARLGNLDDHFALPRISLFAADLDATAGGMVTLEQVGARIVVTYVDVPHRTTGELNNVQVEMYFDGRIRLTYLDADPGTSIVGLSFGPGAQPADFVETDFNMEFTTKGLEAAF